MLNISQCGITEAVMGISVESIYFTDLKPMTYFLKATFKGLHHFFSTLALMCIVPDETVKLLSDNPSSGEEVRGQRPPCGKGCGNLRVSHKSELPSETKPQVEKLRKN